MYEPTPTIYPADVAAKQADGWMLLDVRTDEEWAQGRIEGSVHIPMDQLLRRLEEVAIQVVCICAVGGRSERVTQYLNQHGFEAVNLEGGVYGWYAEGRPLTV